MAKKTVSGAEFKKFYADPATWDSDDQKAAWYVEDLELSVNGTTMVDGDLFDSFGDNLENLPDDAKVVTRGGWMLWQGKGEGPKQKEKSLEKVFNDWSKNQTSVYITATFEVPKNDTTEQQRLIDLLINLGGKVQRSDGLSVTASVNTESSTKTIGEVQSEEKSKKEHEDMLSAAAKYQRQPDIDALNAERAPSIPSRTLEQEIKRVTDSQGQYLGKFEIQDIANENLYSSYKTALRRARALGLVSTDDVIDERTCSLSMEKATRIFGTEDMWARAWTSPLPSMEGDATMEWLAGQPSGEPSDVEEEATASKRAAKKPKR